MIQVKAFALLMTFRNVLFLAFEPFFWSFLKAFIAAKTGIRQKAPEGLFYNYFIRKSIYFWKVMFFFTISRIVAKNHYYSEKRTLEVLKFKFSRKKDPSI